MTEVQNNTVKLTEVFESVKTFLQYFLSQWKLVLLIWITIIIIGVLYFFGQKPKYEADATFVLEEKSSSSGALAGLASQFGFDVGGMAGSSGFFSGDNILDILKSRQVVESVLLSKVDSVNGPKSIVLADLFLDLSKWKRKWKNKDSELANLSFANCTPVNHHSLTQDSILYRIYEAVCKDYLNTERLNKKGSIIRISTTSSNSVFSKYLTERLVMEAKKMYLDIKVGIATSNVVRLQQRADSLLRVINAKSYQQASDQVLDANPARKVDIVPVEISQRDKSVALAVYSEVMKNLEISKMTLSQQTPIIQLLDMPKFPLEDQKKEFSVIAGLSVLVGLAFAFVICVFKYR